MRTLSGMLFLGSFLFAASFASAQPPEGPDPGPDQAPQLPDVVSRMMAFDKNNDGKLTRREVTDQRLLRLFDRADANKDGSVTRAELTALADREPTNDRGGPGGGRGGPGGGGPPGGGRGGAMMGGPPRPGTVLPLMLQQRLNFTLEQKAQLEDLQKDVDARLAKILTTEQKTQLREMGQRGPGGPGGGPPGGGPGGGGPPGGGRGGPGGGGPPPPPGE